METKTFILDAINRLTALIDVCVYVCVCVCVRASNQHLFSHFQLFSHYQFIRYSLENGNKILQELKS